jgi:hypothetical protein
MDEAEFTDALTQWRAKRAKHVQRSAPEYVTKRMDDALIEPETMSAQEQRGWDNWLNAHLDALREEVLDGVADLILDWRKERDATAKEVSELKIEIAELRSELRAMREERQALRNTGLVDVGGNKLKRNGIFDAH